MALIPQLNTVGTQTVGYVTEKGVLAGDTLMVRKFDQTAIASGSFSEIWIGIRWTFNPMYIWSGSNVPDNTYDYQDRFFIGLCDTKKGVFGQSGSNGFSSSMMGQSLMVYSRAGTSITQNSLTGASTGSFNVTGSVYYYPGNTNTNTLSENTGSVIKSSNSQATTYQYRSFTNPPKAAISIFCFAASSSNLWGAGVIHQNTLSASLVEHTTSSLVDMMSTSSWANIALPAGYVKSAPNDAPYGLSVPVDMTHVDGMFILLTTGRYTRYNILDVLVRKKA